VTVTLVVKLFRTQPEQYKTDRQAPNDCQRTLVK